MPYSPAPPGMQVNVNKRVANFQKAIFHQFFKILSTLPHLHVLQLVRKIIDKEIVLLMLSGLLSIALTGMTVFVSENGITFRY